MEKDFTHLRKWSTKRPIGLLVLSIFILTLTVAPTVKANDVAINLSPTQGPVGTHVSVYGMGFVTGQVTITLNSKYIAGSYTGWLGRITASYTIPSMPTGTYTVTATDSVGNKASATFTVTSSTGTGSSSAFISLSSSQGLSGTTIRVTGSGFSAGGSVSVNFDSTYVAGSTADGSGNINSAFNIPSVPAGAYTISVSGTGGKYAAATFIVTQASATMGTGLSPTTSPKATKTAFWTLPVTALLTVAVAIAVTLPLMFIYRRRSKGDMLLNEEPQSYKPEPPTTLRTIKQSTAASKYDQFPITRHTQPLSYNPTIPKKPVVTSAYSQLGRTTQSTNTKTCPHCRQNVKADYNVCPYCRKRLK